MATLPGTAQTFWWKEPESKVHSSVFSFLKRLQQHQHHRTERNLKYLRLYSNFQHLGFGPHQHFVPKSDLSIKHRVTLNIIQSMCDTVQSKITQGAPRVRFLTSGGDFRLKRQAQKLTKFIDGQFALTKFYAKASRAFLDSCILGTGAIKLFTKNDQLHAERVFIDEIKLDETEAIHGEPRQMHQVKFIHKEVLKEQFPDAAGMIEGLSANDLHFHTEARVMDMVEVVESWHLPSSPKASDGRHTITISNKTLLDEEYDKTYFPFIFFRWNERPIGFFGQGLAEQLQGIQLEMNKILRTIQIAMHLTSVPKVFVESGSKVITAQLNNEIGGIIKYTGQKPSYESTGAISPELFLHLDRLYQRGFEIAGISQLSAQSLKPSGLDSGKALREFNDIESERFYSIARRYEEAFLEAARLMIDMAKDLYKETPDISFKVKGDQFLETIKWSEVDLEDDKYIMDLYPTNALSKDPSSRLADVQEMMAAGLVDPIEGRRLLQYPDLESLQNLENAAIRNIERVIEIMIEEGKYIPPEPFQNLELGLKKMQEAYLMFQTENVEEERLELLRTWMADAEALVQRAVQEEMQRQMQAQMQAQLQLQQQQQAQAQQQVAGNAAAQDAAQLSDEEEAIAIEQGIPPELASTLPA